MLKKLENLWYKNIIYRYYKHISRVIFNDTMYILY